MDDWRYDFLKEEIKRFAMTSTKWTGGPGKSRTGKCSPM